jgi:hypothetical protein
MNTFARWRLTVLIHDRGSAAGLQLRLDRSYAFGDMFTMTVVGLSVAAIPEGCLPCSQSTSRWACRP